MAIISRYRSSYIVCFIYVWFGLMGIKRLDPARRTVKLCFSRIWVKKECKCHYAYMVEEIVFNVMAQWEIVETRYIGT